MKEKCIKGQKTDFQGAEAWSASKSREEPPRVCLEHVSGTELLFIPFPSRVFRHIMFLSFGATGWTSSVTQGFLSLSGQEKHLLSTAIPQ